ncbi:hypothetical protein [Burkholderia vietnamiensis]|uniref:hypothetical protein n=1 Tax=Burkholderia vietnamiensis TaxID=60552 RepID=UPI001CC38618|nr:hypothetical protein [Burkholderia vietnamiensis]HDR8964468.1 hypothetical protein [Burkholderia vietnamiensis]
MVFSYAADLKGEIHEAQCAPMIPHYGFGFRNADFLVKSEGHSYNELHWLSRCGNLRMSPPPSSKGGLSPNQRFGLFFRAMQTSARGLRGLKAL